MKFSKCLRRLFFSRSSSSRRYPSPRPRLGFLALCASPVDRCRLRERRNREDISRGEVSSSRESQRPERRKSCFELGKFSKNQKSKRACSRRRLEISTASYFIKQYYLVLYLLYYRRESHDDVLSFYVMMFLLMMSERKNDFFLCRQWRIFSLFPPPSSGFSHTFDLHTTKQTLIQPVERRRNRRRRRQGRRKTTTATCFRSPPPRFR